MDTQWAMHQLTVHGATIEHLCRSVSKSDSKIAPDAESWSIVQVIAHLYDEERDDFRLLLDRALAHPAADWSPAIATSQQEALPSLLDAFLAERQRSLVWLASLPSPDWQRTIIHDRGFTLQAGDILAAWVAHDLLHIRQLMEIRLHLVALAVQPYSIRYADDV